MSRGLAPAAIVSNMSTSQWAINFMPFSLFLEELVRAFAGQFRGILNLKFFKTYLITFCEMRWADPFCKLVICNPTRRRYWESVSSILLFGLGAAYVMQCIAIAMQYFFYIFASAGSIREISAQHQFETESSKRSTRRTADVFATEDFAHENLQPHPILQL